MAKTKFFMDDYEIRRSYLGATDRAAQVRVLADLNAVPIGTMRAKLLALDLPLDDAPAVGRKKKETTNAPTAGPAPSEAVEAIERACTVQALYAHLDRFMRAGWGEAPLVLNGKALSIGVLSVGRDGRGGVFVDLRGA